MSAGIRTTPRSMTRQASSNCRSPNCAGSRRRPPAIDRVAAGRRSAGAAEEIDEAQFVDLGGCRERRLYLCVELVELGDDRRLIDRLDVADAVLRDIDRIG